MRGPLSPTETLIPSLSPKHLDFYIRSRRAQFSGCPSVGLHDSALTQADCPAPAQDPSVLSRGVCQGRRTLNSEEQHGGDLCPVEQEHTGRSLGKDGSHTSAASFSLPSSYCLSSSSELSDM